MCVAPHEPIFEPVFKPIPTLWATQKADELLD